MKKNTLLHLASLFSLCALTACTTPDYQAKKVIEQKAAVSAAMRAFSESDSTSDAPKMTPAQIAKASLLQASAASPETPRNQCRMYPRIEIHRFNGDLSLNHDTSFQLIEALKKQDFSAQSVDLLMQSNQRSKATERLQELNRYQPIQLPEPTPGLNVRTGMMLAGYYQTQTDITSIQSIIGDPEASGSLCFSDLVFVVRAPSTIFIPHEIVKGSCLYKESLAHENRHDDERLQSMDKAAQRIQTEWNIQAGIREFAARKHKKLPLSNEDMMGFIGYYAEQMSYFMDFQSLKDSVKLDAPDGDYARISQTCSADIKAFKNAVFKESL